MKDYGYVKDLAGIKNINEVCKYVKALDLLKCDKLKSVYLAIILTEYTLEGDNTIPKLNEKFGDLFKDKT